jgi:hypothetical protein
VRVENATLLDLFEIAKEIFSNVSLPEGSIFMFGSASYLGRSGTSLYARGWTEVVALASETWRGIRICPLIPLILSECPGTIVRELSELATWLDRVYETNPQGLREPWQCLVKAMEACSTGLTSLENMDNYKVVLPGTLLTRNLDTTITFCSTSSRPMTCKGLSKDSYGELLGSLLAFIFKKFRACSRPEDYFERATEKKVTSETPGQKVTLIGASNLRHCVPQVAGLGVQVIDHTLPGWTPSPGNVAKLQNEIETDLSSSYVFDLYGNSSLRFEQYDGTTALPFQSNGRFHFGGKVVTTPPEIFKKIVDTTIPIIRTKGDNPGVIIPPLPRGLFSRCCSDSAHCTNAKDDTYVTTLLSGFIGLRNDLIKHLVHAGLTNFKVMDSCCVTNCSPTANLPERLEGLQKVTSKDGIHFSTEGYKNLSTRVLQCIEGMQSQKKTEKCNKKTYFWRGFRSPVGSRSRNVTAGNPIATRGAPRGRARGGRLVAQHRLFHPYKRW